MATSIGSSIGNALLERLFIRGTVRELESVTPSMRRVRIHAPALATLGYQAGQQVRVQVGEVFGLDLVKGDTLRTYSVWQHDRANAWIDLCVLNHPGQGPGARWAARLTAGAQVSFRAPEGKFVAQKHDGTHLLMGDETASVALGAIARVLPTSSRVLAIVETESVAERLPLPASVTVEWVVRNARPTGDSALLLEALSRIGRELRTESGQAQHTAYLAGEAKTCKALRAMLTGELRWPSRDVLIKPFWMPGKKGLE